MLLSQFVISADVMFSKSITYVNKEISKSTSLEPEDDFMYFLGNSSFLYVNVDRMSQRYEQVYTRHARSTIDVSVVPVSLITETISGENVAIPSPSVDIDSQSDLDIPIAHHKGKRSCTLYSLYNFLSYAHFSHNIVLLFPPLILILFPCLFHMPCQIQVSRHRWKMRCMS